MYNRYIPNGGVYTRIPMEDSPEHRGAAAREHGAQGRFHQETARQGAGHQESDYHGVSPGGTASFPFRAGEGPLQGLSKIWKSLKIDRLDSGDLLLLLIVLLLLTEGDDLELMIALGLVIMLGLGDDDDP